MRTYPLPSIWFKTVKGQPDLEQFNWDEIALVLLDHGRIRLHASPNNDGFDRYSIVFRIENESHSAVRSEILDVLRRELPRRFGGS